MRCLAHIADGQVRLISRRGRCVTAQYPELAALPAALGAAQAVLDGEIVVADETGHADFDRLMGRMRVECSQRVRWEQHQTPVCFVAFDLLFVDGRDLRQEPFVERKSLLRQTLKLNEHLAYSDHIEGDGEAFYRAVCERGIEGVVAKRRAVHQLRSADTAMAQVEAAWGCGEVGTATDPQVSAAGPHAASSVLGRRLEATPVRPRF